MLRENKEEIVLSLVDINGIRPLMCKHQILLEDSRKPIIEAQRWLNPTMKEVVCKGVLNGLMWE